MVASAQPRDTQGSGGLHTFHGDTRKHIIPLGFTTRRNRGIYYEPEKRLWRARMYGKGKYVTLGRFASAEMAARAHDMALAFVYGAKPGVLATWRDEDEGKKDKHSLPFQESVKAKLADLRARIRSQATLSADARCAQELRSAAAIAALGSSSAETGTALHYKDTDTGSSSETTSTSSGMNAWSALILAATAEFH